MSPGVLWGYRFADKRQLDVSQERACARSCGTKGLILGAKLDLEERGILEAEAEDRHCPRNHKLWGPWGGSLKMAAPVWRLSLLCSGPVGARSLRRKNHIQQWGKWGDRGESDHVPAPETVLSWAGPGGSFKSHETLNF